MGKESRRRPVSSAHVISLVALFIAVGGGATAVALQGHNTVKSDDIAPQNVKRSDIKRGAVSLNRIARPAQNTLMLGAVPSGRTIRGVVGADYHAFDASASDFGIDVSLPRPARNGLSDDDVFVNVSGWQDGGGQTAPTTTDTNAGCTGTPERPTAPAGKVCIYVSGADHAFNLEGYSALFGTGASRYGFKLKWDASQAGDTFVDATWAYRAP